MKCDKTKRCHSLRVTVAGEEASDDAGHHHQSLSWLREALQETRVVGHLQGAAEEHLCHCSTDRRCSANDGGEHLRKAGSWMRTLQLPAIAAPWGGQLATMLSRQS